MRLETYTGCIGDGYSVEINGNTYDELNPSPEQPVYVSLPVVLLLKIRFTVMVLSHPAEERRISVPDGFSSS